jgi:hypothetical protein
MKADAQTEAAVMAVPDEFNNAVATRNLNKVLDLFTFDPDVFLLGSEAVESATGREELESFFRRVFSRDVAFSWTRNEWIVSAWQRVMRPRLRWTLRYTCQVSKV